MTAGSVTEVAGTTPTTLAAAGSPRNGSVPFISWRDGDCGFVYFLTPFDQIVQASMHSYVLQVRGKSKRWLAFMCRKDPAWLPESGGVCELCDRIGHAAKERFVALGLELRPEHRVLDRSGRLGRQIIAVVPATRKVVQEDGSKGNQPRIGLVAQAAFNFFRPLASLHRTHPLEEHTIEVFRHGQGKQSRFIFSPNELLPDLEPIRAFVPDLTEVMTELGSADRYEHELQWVRPEDQPEFARTNVSAHGPLAKAVMGSGAMA